MVKIKRFAILLDNHSVIKLSISTGMQRCPVGPGFLLGTMSITGLPTPEQRGICKQVKMDSDGRMLAAWLLSRSRQMITDIIRVPMGYEDICTYLLKPDHNNLLIKIVTILNVL